LAARNAPPTTLIRLYKLLKNNSQFLTAQINIQNIFICAVNGGGERDRTDDPLLAKQVLSQLSYTPIVNI
jgi:hypothetical protein